MSTPELHLQTCFVLDAERRIVSTREPSAVAGPLFRVVRGADACAWAVGVGVPARIADELDCIARQEPPALDFRDPPVHARRYLDALAGIDASAQRPESKLRRSDGPAFAFPARLDQGGDVTVIESEAPLGRHFDGWVPGEIEAGCAPVFAILDGGWPVSVCFCARRSDVAAEAGLNTAEPYRRRGFGARVTAAWALAIRASGRVPLYSTAWTNHASLGVARRLGLIAYASSWSIDR